MREIGKVVGTVGNSLIVKAKIVPPMESKVYDKYRKEIGYVKKIFGSVDSPYIEVRVTARIDLLKYVNKKVFMR